jgi:hypothetical protein
MFDLPTSLASSGGSGGLPSEAGSKLPNDEIAKFKAQVAKCWVAPAGVTDAPGFNVVMRVALKPDGALDAEPALVLAPASMPADRYEDWKVLELGFSVDGPTNGFLPPTPGSTSLR